MKAKFVMRSVFEFAWMRERILSSQDIDSARFDVYGDGINFLQKKASTTMVEALHIVKKPKNF